MKGVQQNGDYVHFAPPFLALCQVLGHGSLNYASLLGGELFLGRTVGM